MSHAARLDAALGRIRAQNPDLHLVTSLDETGARRAADAADRRARDGVSRGPLDGCLVGIKDNIAVQGLPWTAGLAGWRDRIAQQDADAVARLRAAGAVILGTLNMHEGALGATTDNPTYGRACNPLDPNRTPGGSSGGSGGAVAAGFVDAALGTDTMGSVRIPAAYCGVLGLKPTEDAVPSGGLAWLAPSLDTIGPLARDAETLAALVAILAAGSSQITLPPARQITLGRPKQLAEVEIEAPVRAAYDRTLAAWQARGAKLCDVDLAGWRPGPARRGGLLLVEAEGAVALADLTISPGAMSDDLHDLLRYGAGLTSARLVEALARIRAARLAARRALAEVDVLVMPTAPQRAFAHDVPVPANQADLTALANFAGLPALSLPVSCSDGFPAGIQLIGPDGTDAALIGLAAALAA